MDKMKLAHDYFMKHGRDGMHMKIDVVAAWEYADAMQKEADSRKPKGLPQALSPEVTHLNNQLAVQKIVHDDEFQPTGYEP